MDGVVGGEECCRGVLEEYLDGGRDGSGCEVGEEACDVCRSSGTEIRP